MARGALAHPGSLVVVGHFDGRPIMGTVMYAVDDPPRDLHPSGWVHHESIITVVRRGEAYVTLGTSLRFTAQDIVCQP